MKIIHILISLLLSLYIQSQNEAETIYDPGKNIDSCIEVLNFGTFHMSYTTDANTTEFDENDIKNQQIVKSIAKELAEFKPTVIIVETVPKYNEGLQKEYKKYLKNPTMKFDTPSEIELLAYEVGRLSGTQRIYGIDHKMNYNYRIGNEIENTVDSNTYSSFYKHPEKTFSILTQENDTDISTRALLKAINQDSYLDFLITVNADMLTYAGTKENFEGADEAAKYYKRNLRMFTNLNRIDLKKDDKVFILMGASHTAFFRDFIKRSPKYYMVDTNNYLK